MLGEGGEVALLGLDHPDRCVETILVIRKDIWDVGD